MSSDILVQYGAVSLNGARHTCAGVPTGASSGAGLIIAGTDTRAECGLRIAFVFILFGAVTGIKKDAVEIILLTATRSLLPGCQILLDVHQADCSS